MGMPPILSSPLFFFKPRLDARTGRGTSSEPLVGREIATGYHSKQQRRENGEMRDSPRWSHGEEGARAEILATGSNLATEDPA